MRFEVDLVLRQQILVLVELPRQPIEELAHRGVEAARQILAQAADAHVAREHAEAGDQLVDVEQQLALAEAVEHHRDGADLHAVRAEPDQMAVDALQLGEQHADIFDTRSGTSTPSSRSTDRQNAMLLDCALR